MTINTSSVITGISQSRTGSMTSVANSGATRPAITSTQGTPAGTATNSSESDSSVSTGDEGKAKTDDPKKPEAKPGEQAQANANISNAVKAATTVPGTKQIEGAGLSAALQAKPTDDPKADSKTNFPGATSVTGDPIRDKVTNLQNDIANLSNGSGQSRIQEATSDQKTLVDSLRSDSAALKRNFGTESPPDQSNQLGSTSQASQGANSAPGYGPGVPGGSFNTNIIGSNINSNNGNGSGNGGPVFELPPSIPPSPQNIPIPQVEVDLGSTTNETDNGVIR